MATLARPAAATDRALAVALVLVLGTLAAAVASPLYVLLLAPLVLGVPHAVADIRFLVVHGPTQLAPRSVLAIGVPLAAMIAMRAGAVYSPLLDVAFGMVAIAGAIVCARGGRQPIALVVLVPVAAAALVWPRAATLVLVHAHNVVAFVIWLAWTRGGLAPAARRIVVAAALAGVALIATGACDRAFAAGGPLDATALAHTLAPGLPAQLAARVVLLYAFAQALHYLVWLVLIPRSFAHASWSRDLGRVGCAAAVAASLAVPLAAAAGDAVQVRSVYLSLISFHAWLELAIMAHLVVARDRLAQS